MLKSLANPALVLLQHGRPTKRFALSAGTIIVGRDKDNAIVLPYSAVSRRHAELIITADSARLRDLKSRNGTKINGVPRAEATLQEGDRISFGSVDVVFSSAPTVNVAATLTLQASQEEIQKETQRQFLRLPDAKAERHLAAFYHLCAWVTDGVDETNGLAKWLDLLVESLRGQAVHYYNTKGQLESVIQREGEKPRIKFAAYLLEKFCGLPEATAYAPKELDRFQQRLGNYHYLIAPLRVSLQRDGTACPVIVVLRPSEWEPFSAEDRVLLQSACQLWLRSGARAEQVRMLKKENQQLRQQSTTLPHHGLLGESEVMRKLRAQLDRIAATRATVLITGETGSGKEVVAHYIHHQSPRAKQPFIKLNCGAIPPGLIESELFGHVRGAFTDAKTDHKGKFALADGGTLFLDEIGELPLSAQTKLLRVLESSEIERIGSEEPSKVDVRILAATNRDLRARVRVGDFREDLLYRLEVARVSVPPLREHLEDVDLLSEYLMRQFCADNGLVDIAFAKDAVMALKSHTWPGNVRELRNTLQRIAIQSEQPLVTAQMVKRSLS